MGDTPHYLDEVRLAVKYDLPIIVVKGSPVCDEIIRNQTEEDSEWNLVDPGEWNGQAGGGGRYLSFLPLSYCLRLLFV